MIGADIEVDAFDAECGAAIPGVTEGVWSKDSDVEYFGWRVPSDLVVFWKSHSFINVSVGDDSVLWEGY